MTVQIKLRRGSNASWNDANPVLASGEPGYNETTKELKIGNGVSAWLDLPVYGGTNEALIRVISEMEIPDSDIRLLLEAMITSGVSEHNHDSRYYSKSEIDAFLGSVEPGSGNKVLLSSYVSGSGANEAPGIQAAIDSILTGVNVGKTLVCDVPKEICISSPINLGDTRGNSQAKIVIMVEGFLRLKALAAMPYMLYHTGVVYARNSVFEFFGNGLACFGLYGRNAGRTEFGSVHAWGLKTSITGIEPMGSGNNNNVVSFDTIRGTSTGSKWTGTATVSARSAESGWNSTDDAAPYTTWTLSSPLPDGLTVREWAADVVHFSDGRVMELRRIVNSTTIEVFNEQRALGVEDTITIVSPLLNWSYYGDTGEFTVKRVDVISCPNACTMTYGGYGVTINALVQQYVYMGITLLKKAVGFNVDYIYSENLLGSVGGTPAPWLVVRDGVNTQVKTGPGVNAGIENFQIMSNNFMSMVKRSEQPLHWYIHRNAGSPLTIPPTKPLVRPKLGAGTENITPGTIQAFRKTSGSHPVRIDNNVANQQSVGLVIFASPVTGGGIPITVSLLNTSLGHTVEGSSPTFTTLTTASSAGFVYWLEEGQTDWKFRPIGAPMDHMTSIAAAPTRIGQTAYAGGVGYMAFGTATTADWKQIT